MFRRLIYRILLIVPITFSILLITLFLFYQLPGVHVLDSRDLELGSERELIQALRLQEDRNPFAHSRSLFYVDAYAGYMPEEHQKIPLMFKPAFRSLCREMHNPQVMNRYAEWVDRQLTSLISGNGHALTPHQFVRLLRARSKAELLSAVQLVNRDVAPELWVLVADAPVDEEVPLVKFSWNGTNNIFHYYLTALIRGTPALYTGSGELVQQKFKRTAWWTLAYTIPALLVGWGVAYLFVLWFYDRPRWLNRIDRWTLLLYSIPTFVLATLALVFLTSHRYGAISELFPYPVFVETRASGLLEIYRYYGAQLVLPMIIFGISPMLLLYRIFHEKIREIRHVQPSFRYLHHLGLSSRDFRLRYLSRYLLVASWAVLSNLVVSVLAGSLIIEWIFNIPGLGRFLYQSIVNYDVPSTVYLIVIFTIIQQLGHILADGLIDYFYPSDYLSKELL